jgi:hypothetical protein
MLLTPTFFLLVRRWRKQDIVFSLVVPFSVEVLDELGARAPRRILAEKGINFERHSFFAVRTQRTANEFRFGLRCGAGEV